MELAKILKEELKVLFKELDDQYVCVTSEFEYFSIIIHAYFLQQGFICNGMLNLEPSDVAIFDLK